MSEWKETDFGKVPSSWKFVSATKFCQKVTDGTHDSPKQQLKGNYLITSKHIKGRNIEFEKAYLISEADFKKINERSQVDQWDVIISMIGEYCGFAYVERNENIKYAVKNVGLFKTANKDNAFWLYYYIQSKIGKNHLDNCKSGTSQPYITLGTLRDYPILVPNSNSEKRAIVSVLTSLDDKIDLLHRQNATLETMAETLFRQWFLEEEKEDWEVGKVEDLFILQRGFDLPIQNRIEGIHPIFAASGFSGGHIEFKVQAPGVTTGRSGLLGKVFLVMDDFWPLNTSLFIKEFRAGTPVFSYFFLKNIDLESFNAGSAVPTLNRNHVHESAAIIPPRDLIKKFETLAYPNYQKIKKNQTQIRTLTALKDTLLPKLMSGEVRVKM